MHREEIKQKEYTFFIKYTLEGSVEKDDSLFVVVNNLVKQIIDEKHL